MDANKIISTARQVLGYVGLALACIALAKFFGFQIPIRGSVEQTALVAIACRMA